MRRQPQELGNRAFDLLVIGGGILGAGIARDAALRGLTVGLLDRADFASGTSSRSSKLIHGGLRYLETYEFNLVRESLRERALLRTLAPQLVRPLDFLFPVYAADPRPRWRIRLGLAVYDSFARRGLSSANQPARHRTLSRQDALHLEPGLAGDQLRGAFLYTDCCEDDARLCLEVIRHAADLGAVCANYCEVTGFRRRSETIETAQVRDVLTGATFEVRARHFINATGPWIENLASARLLSPTQGVHLVVPALTRGRAITFQAFRDRRVLFVIPWGDCSLVGTTDTDWTGDPGAARATRADLDYLLAEVRRLFPSAGEVITTFAGIRPLLRSDSVASARSREHRILQRGNLLTVAGGKYTTFRLIAEQVVNRLSRAPCLTATTPLPVRGPVTVESACADEMAVTVADYMRRRTTLALSRQGAQAEAVAHAMARYLGWTDAQRRASLDAYLTEWNANKP